MNGNGHEIKIPLIRMACKTVSGLLISMVIGAGCNGGGDGDSGGQARVSPEAAFTVSADSGAAPLTVEFDASGSTDRDGTIASYEWDFGDDETGSGSTVQHTYEEAGTYTAELTVTDDDGLTDTATHEIVVETSPPEAAFTVSADSGAAPLTVEFDASGSTDRDGTIASYEWDFGDEETGSGSTVQHTYEEAGTYTAELTVTDDDGLTDTATHEIVVGTAPDAQTYTLSGTVTSAEYVMADSDVNDPNTTPVSNNSFEYAQEITAPVTVNGFVNVDGTGSGYRGDNFVIEGDQDDYYKISLSKGMNITLYMAEDPGLSELNLYLYNDQQTQDDFTCTDENGVASLEAPEDGDYYVRVEAVSDFFTQTITTYALTIGLTGSIAATRHPLRLSDDFVPGEVIVRFKDQASKTVSTFADISSKVSSMGFQTKAGAKGRIRLLRISDRLDKDTFFKRLGVKSALESSIGPGNMDPETEAKMETLWMVRAMQRQSGVQYAEPNYIRKPLQTPNDPYYEYQWHYPLINLPDAWDTTTGSPDVVVAVVDTGVLLDHPDLEGQLVDGYDFISDDEISGDDESGIDDNPDDPGDQEGYEGSSFHGTHVAGTIAALTNNGDGVAGIAWNAKIMPLRAMGKGGGTVYDVIQAVKYAAGIENDSGTVPTNPADIINLSIGGGEYSQTEADLYAEVRGQGVIVIAAAGNEGTDDSLYPAAYEGVVSVSAVTIDEEIASYSNFGDTIDVAAPGGSSTDENGDGYMDGVLSATGDDSNGTTIEMGYAFAIGTSMAAPHVSGVVALMKSLYPGLTPDEFDGLLAKGYLTRDLGDPDRDNYFGHGLIDAYKAVLIAQEAGDTGEFPAILSVSPVSLNFGTSFTSAEVSVENGGGGSLTITDYYTDSSWLSVEPSDDVDDTSGLGPYTVEVVDYNGLSDGFYSGTVTFESGDDRAEVSVFMQKGSGTGTADGGYHYILLLDPDTYEPIKQFDSAGENGTYEYSFSGLSSGDTYIIYAGTDPDNDTYICDECEACGAYISLDKPVELTIDGDMEGIDFTTDINISLPTVSTSQFAADNMPLQRDILKGVVK